MRLNIFGLVVGAILAALLIAWGIAGAAPADQYACRWYYMPVIFGTLPDDTTDPLPGEVFPDGPLVCVDGDPQQPTPEATATSTVAPTPDATATVEPTATATIEPTATVGVTETVTPEPTATCEPDDDDDDGDDDGECDED
jgi:hypothetical protein